ncbi:MAG TPA: signal peptidase I [Solirubrobacteraceae bacterium]|jgi:signal peptidase I
MTRAVTIAALTLAALLLIPSAFGVSRYAITGQSMGEALPVGSLVFTKAVDVRDLRAGDVVTFRPPGLAETVTHRVVATGVVVRTRGDANRATDPWRLTRAVAVRRVVFHVPLAGDAAAMLRGPVLVGVAALLVVAALLGGSAPSLRLPRTRETI